MKKLYRKFVCILFCFTLLYIFVFCKVNTLKASMLFENLIYNFEYPFYLLMRQNHLGSDHIQLCDENGNLRIEIYTGSCSNKELNIIIHWTWMNPPLLSGPGIVDRVRLSWQGTDLSGEPIDLSDFGTTYAMVLYDQGSKYMSTEIIKPLDVDIPIHMQKGEGVAIHGFLTTTLRNSDIDNIQEAGIEFEYGHTKPYFKWMKIGPISIPFFCLDNEKYDVRVVKRITNTGMILD